MKPNAKLISTLQIKGEKNFVVVVVVDFNEMVQMTLSLFICNLIPMTI
jgi:hypothetical protein